MGKTLVIVESPAKARTIQRFLDSKDFDIQASYGHVRDLPESADEIPDEIRKQKWGRLGVDTDHDFKPYYVIPNDKRKHVAALKAALKGASEVFLATDPDREGESISWHLMEVLKPKVPVKRIVFHEITESAILEAVKDAHDVNENLVRAQESRRILDRLYGYTLSPVLWKKVQTGLSAGRVQSVAVRLIVDREQERLEFTAAMCQRRGEGVQSRHEPVRTYPLKIRIAPQAAVEDLLGRCTRHELSLPKLSRSSLRPQTQDVRVLRCRAARSAFVHSSGVGALATRRG